MRKGYRILMLAVLAAAITVPLGFALSLESTPTRAAATPPAPRDVSGVADTTIVAASKVRPHLPLVQTAVPPRSGLLALPDGAKLFLVGLALFGLAGVMRRTN